MEVANLQRAYFMKMFYDANSGKKSKKMDVENFLFKKRKVSNEDIQNVINVKTYFSQYKKFNDAKKSIQRGERI